MTPNSRLINPIDAQRIEAAVDDELIPCNRSQATTLVAELLGAFPEFMATRRTSEQERDFQVYAIKLCEAFMQFSFAVGKTIVHGGTGVPSKTSFKPKAADIVNFGNAEKEKRLNVKTMAQRHRAEAKRRLEEAVDDQKYIPQDGNIEARNARVREAIDRFKRSVSA